MCNLIQISLHSIIYMYKLFKFDESRQLFSHVLQS